MEAGKETEEEDRPMTKHLLIAASLLVVAAGAAPAWAGWGCAYDSSAGVGRVWAAETEEEARDQTMHNCTVRNFKRCRIIGCSDNVDSKEDADRLWSRTPGIRYERCGGPGEKKCI